MATIHSVAKATRAHGGCEACGKPINAGDSYIWVQPRPCPGGRGVKRVRCVACPPWQPWELSSSRMSSVYRAQSEFDTTIANAQASDDVQTALDELCATINEVADEYEESADNVEEGFQHATSTSEELREKAEQLRDWASTLEGLDIPDSDDEEYILPCAACDGTARCRHCAGTGHCPGETSSLACPVCTGSGACPACEGHGHSEEIDLDAWHSAVQDALSEAQDCPVG